MARLRVPAVFPPSPRGPPLVQPPRRQPLGRPAGQQREHDPQGSGRRRVTRRPAQRDHEAVPRRLAGEARHRFHGRVFFLRPAPPPPEPGRAACVRWQCLRPGPLPRRSARSLPGPAARGHPRHHRWHTHRQPRHRWQPGGSAAGFPARHHTGGKTDRSIGSAGHRAGHLVRGRADHRRCHRRRPWVGGKNRRRHRP